MCSSDLINSLDDREVSRTAAIIRSMTPTERANPKILNASRRLRIANGSGTKVSDINSLVDRFSMAQKVMKQMSKGGAPQMPGIPPIPGMPGMGGGSKRPPQQQVQKKKSRSGNPAKRAAEEAGETFKLPGAFKGLVD